jgi:glycine oxidase
VSDKSGFDAVFVGGGVIGLASAWRAAERGAEVVVVERSERPHAGATGVAAGMLAPVGELTFGERELLRLALESAQLWPAFAAAVEEASGVETGYERCGALHVALDRDEAAQLRRRYDLQCECGLAAEWLAPRACRELEPGLTPSCNGGVQAAHEGAVDPRALSMALLAALAGRGVEVRSGREVVGGVWDGERLAGVRTVGGEEGEAELRADAVVLCTGAWSGTAGWLPEEARPPVRPVKGQVLELRTRSGQEPPAHGIVASERVYLVPRHDGRLIVGATQEEQGFDTTVTAGGAHELLREAYRVLPEVAEMELAGAIAGLRPGTPDNLPRIGPGAVEGLVLATGHFRTGILLAPLTADAVAAHLAGEPPSDLAALASPARLSFVTGGVTKDNHGPGERTMAVAARALVEEAR